MSARSSSTGWSRIQSVKWYSDKPASRCGLQNSVVHEKTPRWSYIQSCAPPLITCLGSYLKSWKTDTAGGPGRAGSSSPNNPVRGWFGGREIFVWGAPVRPPGSAVQGGVGVGAGDVGRL